VSPAGRQAGVRLEGFIVDVSRERREICIVCNLSAAAFAVQCLSTGHENATSFGLCAAFSRLNGGNKKRMCFIFIFIFALPIYISIRVPSWLKAVGIVAEHLAQPVGNRKWFYYCVFLKTHDFWLATYDLDMGVPPLIEAGPGFPLIRRRP